MEVSGDEGFGALLARAEAGCAKARRGPPVTFLERVRACGREGVSNRNPLFAVAVEDVADVRHPEPRADVILRVDRGEVRTVAVDYSARPLDAAVVCRFAGHVLRLAADGRARPTVPIALLNMLDTRERAGIEAAGLGPERAIPRCGVHDLVLEQAARTPAAPAIADHGTTCTYAELERLSARLGAALAARGLGPGARIGLLVAAGTSQIAALLGILRTGAAVAPLDPTWPPARLRWAASDAGLALIVADAAHRPGVPDGVSILDVAETAGPSPEMFPAVQPDDPLYLLYTSGSTGVPKAVVVPHRTLLNLIGWQRARAADPRPLRTLQRTSLAFDVGFQEVLTTLAGGGCLVIADWTSAPTSRAPPRSSPGTDPTPVPSAGRARPARPFARAAARPRSVARDHRRRPAPHHADHGSSGSFPTAGSTTSTVRRRRTSWPRTCWKARPPLA
jgi:non-ribosomal peptide synthetase component F